MRLPILGLLLACLPLGAAAQMYKCTQPDGRVGFQDRPCQGSGTQTAVEVRQPALLGNAEDMRKAGEEAARRREFEHQQQSHEQLASERKARAEAPKRRHLCERASRSMAVLREQRPVYHTDAQGNPQYLPDSERAEEIAAVQRVIDETCD